MAETLKSQLEARRMENDPFNDSIDKREITVPSPQTGEKAPLFSLPDENGNSVLLADLLKKGPVIVSFFKGNWCQLCDLELKALQRALPEFKKYGATILGISPHTVSISYQLKTEKALSYTILSDAGNEIAHMYGLRFKLQKVAMDVFASFGFEDMTPLHGDQGDNTNTLPIPGTFVVGMDGKIIYSFVDSDHTRRAEPSEIVAALMTSA
jgi:peroxiredoxin